MFTTNAFVLLALAVPFLVRADVNPTVPAPEAIYNTGSPCLIAWTGDSNSTTIWKNMAIQLMSGSNFNMMPITTVATGQDGTVSGQFTFTCPQVIPNSAIYFYQFTSANTPDVAWTTRFAIASSSGQTTLPANATQPDDGAAIPWGTGRLANPSLAIAPPFASSTGSGLLSSSSSSNITSSPTAATNASLSPTSVPTSVVPSISSVSLSTALPTAAQVSTSGASDAMTAFDIRVLGAAAAATLALSFIW